MKILFAVIMICTIRSGHSFIPVWIAQFIKSPRYTGVDFMSLYRFVRRHRPQTFVRVITFD